MRGYLPQLLEGAQDPLQKRNLVREYLQARILGALQKAGAMNSVAFQGGTALRFLYSLPRYSEDLDFSLEGGAAGYDFRGWLASVRSELSVEGYTIDVRLKEDRTVHSSWVRFEGVLHDLGLSSHRGETLSVRVEVDTHPPAGAVLETRLVRRHMTLRLRHHDRASLLAGKLYAVLQRPYVKGRDIYDLGWYLADPEWPPPNLDLLNNALAQTGWSGKPLTPETWRGAVARRLREFSWDRVVADVRPFLERSSDLSLLDREDLLQSLSRRR